jgi:hypothetical protein
MKRLQCRALDFEDLSIFNIGLPIRWLVFVDCSLRTYLEQIRYSIDMIMMPMRQQRFVDNGILFLED